MVHPSDHSPHKLYFVSRNFGFIYDDTLMHRQTSVGCVFLDFLTGRTQFWTRSSSMWLTLNYRYVHNPMAENVTLTVGVLINAVTATLRVASRHSHIYLLRVKYFRRMSDLSESLLDFKSWRDRLCGLVVRVSGYRTRGPGFHSRRFQIFWEPMGLERGPLSLVRTTEELLGINSSGSGQKKRDLPGGSVALTTQNPLSAKVGTTSPTSGGRSAGIVR
jgi:hypothetical protein